MNNSNFSANYYIHCYLLYIENSVFTLYLFFLLLMRNNELISNKKLNSTFIMALKIILFSTSRETLLIASTYTNCITIIILLEKFENYGIRVVTYSRIKSFLCIRKQLVSVHGQLSNLREMGYGVPQRSTLESKLYVMYVNDMIKTNK